MSVVSRSLGRVALVLLPLVAACSGAGNRESLEANGESNDTSATDPAPSTSTSPGTSGSSGKNGSGDEGGSSGGTTSGGTPTPAPTGKDAGPPPPTCTPEDEPNDDAADATPFDTRVCGKIASASDVDYVTFDAPNDADFVHVTHTEKNGSALYKYYVAGLPVAIQGGALRLVRGATYTVQIRLDKSGAGLPSYEVDVAFQ